MYHLDPKKHLLLIVMQHWKDLEQCCTNEVTIKKSTQFALLVVALNLMKRNGLSLSWRQIAVVWALETFRVYIDFVYVLVRTDHSPLIWIRNHAAKAARCRTFSLNYSIEQVRPTL